MIEVEKKFHLTNEQKEKLVQGAVLVEEKTFTDVYYDTANFSLTSSDRWLRSRDGKFELKLPHNTESSSQRFLDQYEELETDEEIATALKLALQNHSLSEVFHTKGFEPFATLTTTRTKWKKGGFILDFDSIDFGYEIGEIELMVEDASQMQAALEKIKAFAGQHGLELAPVRGKVIEYIRLKNPKHFETLQKTGVV